MSKSMFNAPHFQSVEAAREYLEALRWGSERVCPHCGTVDNSYPLKNQRSKPSKKNPNGIERHGLYKCGDCRKQFTVRIGTDGPAPTLAADFVRLFVVSHTAAAGLTRDNHNEAFNTGKATIGTGPFRFISWTPKSELVLERFDQYWHGPAAFGRVVRKEIPNDTVWSPILPSAKEALDRFSVPYTRGATSSVRGPTKAEPPPASGAVKRYRGEDYYFMGGDPNKAENWRKAPAKR